MEKIVNREEKMRIDKFLANKSEYSRSTIEKMIEQELVLVNGVAVKPSYKVQVDDTVEIVGNLEMMSDLKPAEIKLDIVYEDEDLIVINKPSGLVVHPGSGNYENTLANGLLFYTEQLSDINGDFRPGIVHRLDKDTSGLMLVCKTNKAHQILSEDFSQHEVKREYIALLDGVFPHQKAKIDAPIGRDLNDRKKMNVVATNSKRAVTYLSVYKRYEKNTLVRLNLETGRTHQIRVHMKYIGFPVFNDPLYGKNRMKEYGQFLHSRTLDFVHPITKEKMHFECDLPKYFEDYLKTLKEKSD